MARGKDKSDTLLIGCSSLPDGCDLKATLIFILVLMMILSMAAKNRRQQQQEEQ
jgi:hypothetical protein